MYFNSFESANSFLYPLVNNLTFRRLLDSDPGTGTDEDVTQPDSSPASSTIGEASLRCFHIEDAAFHQKSACHACGAATQFIPIPVPIPVPYPVHEWTNPFQESMMLYDAARLRSLPRTFWPPVSYLSQALFWPTLYTQLENRNVTARLDRDDDVPADSSSVAEIASAETNVREPTTQQAEVSGYLECEYGDVDSSDSSSDDELPIKRIYNVSGRVKRDSDDALPSSDDVSTDEECRLSQSSHLEDDMTSSGSSDTDSDDTGTVADKPKKFSRIFVVNRNASSSLSKSSSDTDSSDNDTDTEMDCMVVLKNVKQLSEETSEIFEGCDNDRGMYSSTLNICHSNLKIFYT